MAFISVEIIRRLLQNKRNYNNFKVKVKEMEK